MVNRGVLPGKTTVRAALFLWLGGGFVVMSAVVHSLCLPSVHFPRTLRFPFSILATFGRVKVGIKCNISATMDIRLPQVCTTPRIAARRLSPRLNSVVIWHRQSADHRPLPVHFTSRRSLRRRMRKSSGFARFRSGRRCNAGYQASPFSNRIQLARFRWRSTAEYGR